MNFSVRAGLLVMSGVAACFASFRYANEVAAACCYSLSFLTLMCATVAAIYCRGLPRSFWVGFVLFGWGYLFMAYGHTNAAYNPNLLTSTFINSAHEVLQHEGGRRFPRQNINMSPVESRMMSIAWQRNIFQRIGHSWFTLALACFGGCFAKTIAKQEATTTRN